MRLAQYDVIVVGAGCSGLTAAIGLARAGFTVAVLEAGTMPPSGGSSIGGVCFTESLAQPDILGADGVEALAWERRLIERGLFATDGRRLIGSTYRDASAFRHCYTVLRSSFNHSLLQIALKQGAALWAETTVESLIRDGRRIIGVATTGGPLYANLVFLAEGDAGHLVSREGFDRSNDPRDAPAFLYSLQQIIELPPEAIEESFGVGPEQGAAYELLLRNRAHTPLNVRGFVCTNRQGLILGVVLPAEHLRHYFAGEPRQLLDWFVDMPALRPWWRDGRAGAWTATLLRAGGLRDVPYLVEDGLVVGGAAAGLGVDFPVMNGTGPATATGLLLSRAASAIRAERGDFDREQLRRHYLEPLQRSRYWKDMAFLQRWPGYLKRTRVLFDQEIDWLLDSAAIWTRPRRWLPRKLFAWFNALAKIRWPQWGQWRDDLLDVGRALRFRELRPRMAPARLVLDSALNAFRDLARQPRPHLPLGGTLRLVYRSSEEDSSEKAMPALLRRWFGRFRPVLASAAHILYGNDDTPLSAKMIGTMHLLVRQVNLLDLVVAAGLAFLALPAIFTLGIGRTVLRWNRLRPPDSAPIDPILAGTEKERVDSQLSSPQSNPAIHVVLKSTQPRQRADTVANLNHLCPTGVFEVRGEPPEFVRIWIHSEKCIHCEACWRSNPFVDWARGGEQSVLPPLLPPAGTGLHEAQDRSAMARPEEGELAQLIDQLDGKLSEFDKALARGAAIIDRPRSDYLETLARYAQQLAVRIREVLEGGTWPLDGEARGRLLKLAGALLAKAEERTRRTWDGRFAWAAADGRQMRQHHLTGLRRLLAFDATPERNLSPDLFAGLRSIGISSSLSAWNADAVRQHLLADIAAKRYLLETLAACAEPMESPARIELLMALAWELRALVASRTAELSASLGDSLEESPSSRENAPEIYRRQGVRLLEDAGLLGVLLDVPGDWSTLAQRRALLTEWEELRKAEGRLDALANDLRDRPPDPSAVAEGSRELARQAAHVLAGKRLLLQTHARCEEGRDAELAIVLLRVWLDYAATMLDQFTILVRDRLRPSLPDNGRPLVEPGAAPPPRTLAEFLAQPAPYTTGDFLLAPIDLLQPRVVPEMVGGEELPTDPSTAELLRAVREIRDSSATALHGRENLYLAEALAVEMVGRSLHPHTRSLELELACARLIVAELRQAGSALRQRCAILRELSEQVAPRWAHAGIGTGVRHLGREVLELEALKADFRQRLLAVWQFFGEAFGQNPDIEASCFALAEAAAWLKAADSTLGRMAWLSRLSQAEERDETSMLPNTGQRILVRCHAEARDRLFRFDEDLAALRRGYCAPHVRAAALLLMAEPEQPTRENHAANMKSHQLLT